MWRVRKDLKPIRFKSAEFAGQQGGAHELR
jgi:hypothetical protein